MKFHIMVRDICIKVVNANSNRKKLLPLIKEVRKKRDAQDKLVDLYEAEAGKFWQAYGNRFNPWEMLLGQIENETDKACDVLDDLKGELYTLEYNLEEIEEYVAAAHDNLTEAVGFY